ncbi:MAG: L,D-transpeptidase family protein [Chitinophagaceae bacterium]
MKQLYATAIFILVLLISCKQKQRKYIVKDTTITEKTSFNNLFFDSLQLDKFLDKDSSLLKYKEHFHDFYKQRNYEFAWFDKNGLAEQAYNFYNLLNNTVAEFQDSSIYNPKMLTSFDYFTTHQIAKTKQEDVLNAELLMTGQFFDYAAKVYKGIDIDASELGWFIPRKKVDLTALLDSVLSTKAKEAEVYVPFNSQYKKLQEQLLQYYQIQKKYPVDTLAKTIKPLAKGDTSSLVSLIKHRLFLLGDLEELDSTNKFDTTLQKAVKMFQLRNGLSVTGSIGNKTFDELNVPIKKRIETILINIERARWLPAEKDSNYILVNIPEYKMHVFDSTINTWDMNVIVGKTATGTVIFNGNLRYIVFSPYWNIPSNIVKNEILPGIKKDKDYLIKNDMEKYGKGDSLPLIRQKSGEKNSLGLVKFLFPNNYDIYFHDTPNRDLFTATNRSFSHGCIRLGEPKKLAEYLLRKDTTYTSSKIDSLMHLPKEKWVTLPKSIPVFIVYFTSWVDKNGKLNFRNDIYGHDNKMSEKLFVK